VRVVGGRVQRRRYGMCDSWTRGESMRRHVPRELLSHGQVEVDLVDKKDRNWEAPPVVLKPFSGAGKRLGSR
jgi:hypothetical protein